MMTVYGRAARQYPAPGGLTPELKMVQDSFRNPAANTGYGTANLLEATEYRLTRMGWNYTRLIALYRTSWLTRAVIDTIPEDMTKNWLSITGETEPKLISQLERVVQKTGTKGKILETMKWGRLYGGAGAVILIKGHDKKLDKPLELDDVPIGGYCGLQVFDRWSGITPDTTDLITDISSPYLGLPKYYNIMSPDGSVSTYYPKVHHSRIVRFTGRNLPQWERQAEMYWGLSEIEIIWDSLRMADNSLWNIASMMFTANVFVFKSGANVSQLLAATPSDVQQRMYQVMAAQRALMNSQGMMVTDKDGGLESHQLAFGGIADVLDKFLLILCAAAGIPKSRLLGDTQTGISSSNEGDQNTYYDSIRAKQMRELDPVVDQLLPIIAMSTWGDVPDDFGHGWNPLHSPSNKEKSDLGKQNVEAILAPFTAGVISQRTVLMELKQQAEVTGLFSNVTDDMIDDADDDTNPMGDLGLGDEMGGLGTPKPKKAAAKEAKEPKAETKSAKAETKSGKSDTKQPKKKTKDSALIEFEFAGLPVTIEVPAGQVRIIRNDAGEVVYERFLQHDYGFVRRTVGRDGDEIDVILGPYETAPFAYVIEMIDLGPDVEQRCDEEKCFVGFPDSNSAKAAFLAMYPPDFFGGMEEVPINEFRERMSGATSREIPFLVGAA